MGMYYDRGELFSYFSPGYAIGLVTGGPFGVVQQVPFVTAQTCPAATYQYGYIPTCAGGTSGSLEFPYTNVQNPAPTNPNASDFAAYLPNATAIINGAQPISLGVYDRKNKLPYSINYTLDVQWQPRNDLAFDFGYVGNLGRHQVIPVPFNQPNIASPSAADPLAELFLRLHAHQSPMAASLPWETARPRCSTSKAATSTCAFPISVTRLSPSPTRRPAFRLTTPCRCMWRSA